MRTSPDTGVPLSLGQESFVTLAAAPGADAAFRIGFCLRFRGPLDVSALSRAMRVFVGRHPALRTHLADAADGRAFQVVQPDAPYVIAVTDARSLTADEQRILLSRQWGEMLKTKWDLYSKVPFEYSLILNTSDESVLVVCVHELIFDRGSTGVFLRDLMDLYAHETSLQPSELHGPLTDFADFCVAQRRAHDHDADSRLGYWRERAAIVLDVPNRKPRTSVKRYVGNTQTTRIRGDCFTLLKTLSSNGGVSTFALVLAVLRCALARLGTQEEIAVATVLDGRNSSKLHDVIGQFAKFVFVADRIDGGLTIVDMASRLQALLADACNHELSLPNLLEATRSVRQPKGADLMHTVITHESVNLDQWSKDELSVVIEEMLPSTAPRDLTIRVIEAKNEVRVDFNYNVDAFEPHHVELLAECFEALLHNALRNPGQPVRTVELVSEERRKWLVAELNDTRTDYPSTVAVHDLVREQAERIPDAIAVRCGERSLTYRELDRRSDGFADELTARGLAIGDAVAIIGEKCVEMIIAILGVLKAGGYYVPIDHDLPEQRRNEWLSIANPKAVVTTKTLAPQLNIPVSVFLLDSDDFAASSRTRTSTLPRVDPRNLAYMLFTSGSTGIPKAVGICHYSIARLLLHTQYIEWTRGDCMAQLSNMSFDGSTFEMWGALLHGLTLALVPKRVLLHAGDLFELFTQGGVTVCVMTPTLVHILLEGDERVLSRMREVWIGGEVLEPSLLARLQRLYPSLRVVNGYGPTESTAFATTKRIETAATSARIPIGRVISNTAVYVLDEEFLPVPCGVEGEIFIAGDGLARGYLGQPALTAERFLPNPFLTSSAVGENRMYRTGDRACVLPNGEIDFLGRVDGQVKIRGQRIELGEIEAACTKHPAVNRAVARAVRDADAGDLRIVAYVEVRKDMTVTGTDLSAFLKARLTDAMLPFHIEVVNSFPMTKNGKVDIDAMRLRGTREPTQRTQDIVGRLTVIWEEVLGRSGIGARENFFEAGGNSLLVVHLRRKIVERFAAQISVVDCFSYPTIAAMAEMLEGRSASSASSSTKMITRIDMTGGRHAATRKAHRALDDE